MGCILQDGTPLFYNDSLKPISLTFRKLFTHSMRLAASGSCSLCPMVMG